VAVLRDDRGFARFGRVTLVLSGGGALGAYQAGAFAAMETAGFEPDSVAATGIGAVAAAIIAGNPPRRRIPQLRQFWSRAHTLTARAGPRSLRHLLRGPASAPGLDPQKLRAALGELIDFSRINAGTVRLSLAATHLATGSEVAFDNDRHVLGPDHIVAAAAAVAAPVQLDGEDYGSAAVAEGAPLQLLLDAVAPADTLCFVIDCFDPDPGKLRGSSRTRHQIAAFRRRNDLRRALGLVAERLPPEIAQDTELASCLVQGSMSSMNLVHLVHETAPAGLGAKAADYRALCTAARWRAGERDMAASLARPAWLAPPPRRLGVVVHEMRGGGAPLPS
jgi:NTE family protein